MINCQINNADCQINKIIVLKRFVYNICHKNMMRSFRFDLFHTLFLRNSVLIVLFVLLATTYIGSVLFRTSAYTGAKQASRVPFWFRDLPRQNRLVPGHLLPVFRPGHLVPSFIMRFNSLMIFFCVSKLTFDQMHIDKFYHISCNTVLCRLFNSVKPLCLYVCMSRNIIIIIIL